MPKKKEPKYEIVLVTKKRDSGLTVCNEEGQPIMITEKEMNFVMHIYDQLKGLIGRDK